jgi:hypothetical protein
MAEVRTASAWLWPQLPTVSMLSTISPVSSTRVIATEALRRRRDRPSARSAMSSELLASCPSPISAPITAAVGNMV